MEKRHHTVQTTIKKNIYDWRHAKKTTITENIIMDEDDIAAIITRS